MNKKNKNIFLSVGIITILILIIGYIQFAQNITGISGRGLTHEIIEDKWGEYDVELQAAHWGSLTSNPSEKIWSSVEPEVSSGTVIYGGQTSEGIYWWHHFDFCNDNDGEHTILNSYKIDSNIRLSSSVKQSSCCSSANYASAKMTLPSGKLTATCTLKASDSYNEGSATCYLGGKSITVMAGQTQSSSVLELDIEGEKEVLAYITTKGGCKGASSNADMIISFEPNVIEQEEVEEETTVETVQTPVECTSNIECQDVCGTKVPTCESNTCYCGGEQYYQTSIKGVGFNYYSLIPISIIVLLLFIILKGRKKKNK